jgi:hypothetical protein
VVIDNKAYRDAVPPPTPRHSQRPRRRRLVTRVGLHRPGAQDLTRLLGLERFKSERVKWMQGDFEPWFPYQEAYYRTTAPSSIGSVYLSRKPIDEHLPAGSMTTEERMKGMGPDAPPTAKFSKGRRRVPRETEIVSQLAVLAAGLGAPKRSR